MNHILLHGLRCLLDEMLHHHQDHAGSSLFSIRSSWTTPDGCTGPCLTQHITLALPVLYFCDALFQQSMPRKCSLKCLNVLFNQGLTKLSSSGRGYHSTNHHHGNEEHQVDETPTGRRGLIYLVLLVANHFLNYRIYPVLSQYILLTHAKRL